MNKNAKFVIGGLAGVAVLVAVYFSAGSGLQGRIALRQEVPVVEKRDRNVFERDFDVRDNALDR